MNPAHLRALCDDLATAIEECDDDQTATLATLLLVSVPGLLDALDAADARVATLEAAARMPRSTT